MRRRYCFLFGTSCAGWVATPGIVVVPLGIILSAVVVVIFLVTGWLGGELVFRHRIGVIDGKS